jgi:hypothetical protein
MECLSDESDACCFDECFATQSGIYRNDFFNTTALFLSITKGETVDEDDIAVVKKSIQHCEKSRNDKLLTTTCDIPEYVFKFTQCVLKENYRRCPFVVSNPECLQLWKVLDSCKVQTPTKAPAS